MFYVCEDNKTMLHIQLFAKKSDKEFKAYVFNL